MILQFIISLALGVSSASIANEAVQIPRDTSFNVNSAVKKIKKVVPQATEAVLKHPGNVLRLEDEVYSEPYEGRELKAYIFRPVSEKKLLPAVIMIHGGGWSSGTSSLQFPLAERIAAMGFIAIPVEYRLTPEAKYPAGLHDVKTAIRWLKANADRLGVDKNKIAVSGCSAGGQLACLVGMTNGSASHEGNKKEYSDCSSDVNAVVNIDGIATFVSEGNIADARQRYEQKGVLPANGSWLGGLYEDATENWKEASAILWADENAVPVLFINSDLPRYHDGRDELIQKLNAMGIYSEVYEIGSPVHPFWLCDPWIDPTAKKMADFLKKILK